MGTSSAFGGAGGDKPLIPSWLDGGGGPATPPPGDAPAVPADAPTVPGAVPEAPPPRATPAPASGGSGRNRAPRGNISGWAGSGGSDRRRLGRAVSQYVSRSAGGAGTAARRMGSSRTSAARLAGVLSSLQADGLQETLRSLDLAVLAGRTIEEVFAGLADYICPEGGSIDEGIARDAFIETIADLAGAGIHDVDGLTADQMQTVFELYLAHTIEARIINDIGTRLVTLPDDVAAAQRVQDQLHDFVLRGVSDAVTSSGEAVASLTPDQRIRG